MFSYLWKAQCRHVRPLNSFPDDARPRCNTSQTELPMFYLYPNKRYSYIESVFPTIGHLYHGCSKSVCPMIPIHVTWKYLLSSMPVRHKAGLLQLRSPFLHHRYKSSNGDLYKSEARSFHPIPYPAMQEIRHADCSPIFHPDKKEPVPKCAIRANYHFLLSTFRNHDHRFHLYRCKPHKSSATCLPGEKR